MEDSRQDFQRISRYDIVLAVLYGVVIIAGIFGNSLVIAVVWKTRTMHTATNYLLVNLASSDILVLLWCPRTYDFVVTGSLPKGITGDYLCRFFIADPMDILCLGVTLFTLTVLAVERYQALVTPLSTKYKLNKKSVMYAIATTWIASLLISIPHFIFTHVDGNRGKCVSPLGPEVDAGSDKTYVVIAISLYIFIPFLVITYCYCQILRGMFITQTICAGPANVNSEKRKLAILIIAVTVVFYILFLPFAIFMLHVAFTNRLAKEYTETESNVEVLKVLSFLIVANSSLNPVLYAFQSENYRKGFRGLFCPKNSVGQMQNYPLG